MAYLNGKKILFALKRIVSGDVRLSSKKIDKNGKYSATLDNLDGYSSVEVDVPIPEGYIKPKGTLPITENGEADVTNYEKVNVDVPIPEGYIVPEGTLDITDNGEKDVTNYAKVNVAVPIPEPTAEELTVTPTGEKQEFTPTDTDYYSKVTVEAIPPEYTTGDSGLLIEISTEAEMTALLETAPIGAVYKYVGESTDAYENGGIYIVEAVAE